jgi:hypothetical protein
MKNLSLALLLMASMVFVLSGCSDNSNSVVTPSEQVTAATTSSGNLAKMGEDLHSATGNGHWRFVGTQSRVRCLFSAVQHKDGTCSGEVTNNDEGPTFKFHGKVYDLKVEGNRAQMWWKFTRGTNPPGGEPYLDLTGMLGTMVVVDNGNGNSATGGPDLVSLIWCDPPETYDGSLNPPMTIEQIFALSTDEYINYVMNNFGMSYDQFLPAIEMGSVTVR